MPLHITAPYHQDITLLQLRPLPLQSLLNLHDWYLMPRHSRRCLLLFDFSVPRQPIAQYSSPNNTTPLTPVVRSIRVRVRSFFVREAVVVRAAGLVGKVLETVPLRARLRIDVHLIVHSLPLCEVGEVDLLLVELLAVEAGELYIVERPVELDVLAGTDFLGGGLDDGGGEEVDS